MHRTGRVNLLTLSVNKMIKHAFDMLEHLLSDFFKGAFDHFVNSRC